MGRYLTLLTVVAVAILIAGFSTGQEKKPGDDKTEPPRLKGQLPPNWKKLGLNDEQVQKIYKIQNDYDAKEEALKKQIDNLKKEEKVKMRDVLTDAQKARLKEIEEEKK